jgi:hypothetical protein
LGAVSIAEAACTDCEWSPAAEVVADGCEDGAADAVVGSGFCAVFPALITTN